MQMHVDIWSDIACPWCYVGKRRFEAALDFHFETARSGNTFDAHRLVHLAAAHGLQDAMEERLMRGYLSDGELMSDHSALERLGIEVGLDAAEVRDTLATDRFAVEVREDERTAAALGINAVPCFVIDRRMGAPGAQPPEVLGAFLRRGWEARSPLEVVASGDACGPDGC